MQSSTVPPGARLGAPQTASRRLFWPHERPLIFLLGTGVAIVVMLALSAVAFQHEVSLRVAGSGALLFGSVTAAVVFSFLARQPEVWRGTRWLAWASLAPVLLQLAGWTTGAMNAQAQSREVLTGTMSLLVLMLLGALVIDFFDHVRGRRGQLLSDVAVVAVVIGGAAFLLLHKGPMWSGSGWNLISTATIAASALLLMAGWSVLVIWCPTRVHVGMFLSAGLVGVAAIAMEQVRQFGEGSAVAPAAQIAAALAALGVAAILTVEPRLNAGQARQPRATWGVRPGLLALSLCGACGMLTVVLISPGIRLSPVEGVTLSVLVFGTVGLRTVLNQAETVRAARAFEEALQVKESPLASVRAASEIVSASEARHRLLLDAAVDGVVELDANLMIVRANDAFCTMVRLPLEEILGRTWGAMVEHSPGGSSLSTLPETGEATIETDREVTHLEARSSVISSAPPGTLPLIRDVTASKVAEQTIRTLFQFLQDRDEDRTRLLKRSNSAIEAERNRIARDLHDGPIQGISAAALSLEAIKLMIDSGDVKGAAETLHIICDELGQEAINLRRVMSDLRPPVLEERGLVPGVREMCARHQRELGIPVSVVAGPNAALPSDVETLAYRVVQEALSNVGKHAKASRVTVRIEASAGTLTAEVVDDGEGFDPTDARAFLRDGKVGLASMRERAELAGGTLTVRSNPGSGTTVTATLPFEILPAVAPATSDADGDSSRLTPL